MPMVKIKLGVKYTPIKSAKKQVTGISYQLKLGYINMSELTSVMPEAARIDAELKEYEQSLGQLYQDMLKEAENKSALFVKDSLRMTPTMRELKRNEIVELNNKLQNWSKTAQDIYNQKSQEKLGPIFKKALEVVNTTAKEAGYTHVLDSSNNGMVKAPPENDLLPLVKSKLGIK